MTTIKELLREKVLEEIKKVEEWRYLEKYGKIRDLRLYSDGVLCWYIDNEDYNINIAEDLKKEIDVEDMVRDIKRAMIKKMFSVNWKTLQTLIRLFKNVIRMEV